MPRLRLARMIWLLGSILLATASSDALAQSDRGERYFLLLFGAEDSPRQLKNCHTWATYVRTVSGGDDQSNQVVELSTVSWVPASQSVHVFAARPEPGVNLDLEGSFAYVASKGSQVKVFGPFEIRREMYQRAIRMKAALETGGATYRAISSATDQSIFDCIHAVTEVDPLLHRGSYPLSRIGNEAARYIAQQVVNRSMIDQTRVEASWVITQLGLDRRTTEVIPPPRSPRGNGS